MLLLRILLPGPLMHGGGEWGQGMQSTQSPAGKPPDTRAHSKGSPEKLCFWEALRKHKFNSGKVPRNLHH